MLTDVVRECEKTMFYTSVFVVAHAIMSLIATRNKPPVSAFFGINTVPDGVRKEGSMRTVVYHADVLFFRWTL